jgi:hypothetical protein
MKNLVRIEALVEEDIRKKLRDIAFFESRSMSKELVHMILEQHANIFGKGGNC